SGSLSLPPLGSFSPSSSSSGSLSLPLSSGGFSSLLSVSGNGESQSMEFTISSVSRALISGVPGGFSITDLGAESSSASFPKIVSLKRQSSYKLLDTHTKTYKIQVFFENLHW